jgi:hypothetical protein
MPSYEQINEIQAQIELCLKKIDNCLLMAGNNYKAVSMLIEELNILKGRIQLLEGNITCH